MRVVIVDESSLLREMVESLIARLGHEIAGIADTTVDGVGLVSAAKPDVVIFDMSLGYNTDFDVVESALAVGARTVIFSHTADDAILSQYARRPTVVPKPDLVDLEAVLKRLEVVEAEDQAVVVETERRRRPVRAASGEPATGVIDAQAFYNAVNGAEEGDALLSVDLAGEGTRIGEAIVEVMRGTDRLLASPSSVKVFLAGGGHDGITSFLRRLSAAAVMPEGARVTAIVVRAQEDSMDAFERLKREGEEQELP